MSFVANIPASGQSLGASRLQVLNNFSNYNTVVSVDHVAPNSGGQGEHTKVTLRNLGSASYPVDVLVPDRSYISSFGASTAGCQLVYQPSVVNFFVPVSPRSLARITKTGASTFALGNGPYGASTNFNASTPTFGTSVSFTYNFTSTLTSANYFVFATCEGATPFICSVTNKTTSGFLFVASSTFPVGSSVTIMVF